MAFKKKPDPPKSFPLWQSTFSDLMNLLLCFFVLLFSMSTIQQDKLEQVAASISNAFSIMPSGGATVSNGKLVSAGISQLPDIADYFGDSLSKAANDKGNNPNGADSASADASEDQGSRSAEKEVEKKALLESEKMAENVTKEAKRYGIQNRIQVDFNGQYVRLTLNGAFLFNTGESEVKKGARPIIKKVSLLLNSYNNSLIEVEGYTDNVPIHSAKYEDNNVLSMYRALNVANDIRKYSKLDPAKIYSSGRGEYNPVASNKTPEGRARNRRVEIKIYNSYNSKR
ncbi:flagellar motor protein MotB [Candidatus Weimeria sp. HCP3S3_B5]|uniref:flagellar motor protein MotB n=1 Tax=Candidatus Weimeria sp. HCP3S3_B5 TaxID=3438871 RepID=UPI003036CC3E|nr:flagellar motor protein MotB [Lachnospiraceae bacterium]